MAKFLFQEKEVFYLIEGEGEPILLLNGIMMSTKSWQPFVSSLTERNTLIRVDFFDQGQSTKLLGETYSQAIQVALIEALLNHLHIEKTHMVGISYGGEIAIQFAIQYPKRVNRLVLFNTTAYTSPWLKDIGRGWIAAGKTRDGLHYYQTTIPVIYSPHFYEEQIAWMKRREGVLVPIFSTPDFLDQMERLILSAEPYDVREELHLIEAKTLLVSAEMDYLTPVDNQELVYQKLRFKDWVKIPFAGHASMYEKPMLFTALVLGYLNVKDSTYAI